MRTSKNSVLTRATADLSWWSLFMGAPKVGNFRIDKPVVRITRQATRATAAAGGSRGWHWPQLVTDRLERISISDPDVHYDLTTAAGQRHRLQVQGGELRLDFRPADKVLMTLHIDAINYRHDDKQRVQDLSLAATGEFGQQGFAFSIDRLHAKNIEQLQGEVRGQTQVDAQGAMTAPLQVHGDLTLDGDLALLDDLLNITRSHGRGEANFNLALSFAPDTPVDFKAEGRAKVTQAVLGGIKVHDSEAHLTVTPQQLLFEEGKLVVAGEPRGTFHGRVGFAKPLVFDFGGEITRVTFAELMSTFNVKLDIFNFDLATQQVRVHGTGKPFSLQVLADTQLANWQIYRLRNHRDPPVCAMRLDLHSNRQRLRFKQLHGNCVRNEHDSGKLALHGTIAYGTGDLDLHVAAPALNLAAVDFLVPDALQGQGKIEATISGAGEGIVVHTQLDLRQMQLNAEKIGNLTGELDFRRRLVDWRDLRLHPAQGGEVHSLRGTLSYGDLRFDAQLTAREVSADDLQLLLRRAQSPLLFGIDKFSAQLSGFLPFPLAYRGTLRAQLQALRSTKGEKIADTVNVTAQTGKQGWQVVLQKLQRDALFMRGSITQQRKVALSRAKFTASPHLWERLGLSSKDKLQIQLSAAQEGKTAQQLPYLGKHFQARFTTFDLQLAGTVPRLRGEVKASLDTVLLAGMHFGTLQLTGEVDGSTVEAQIRDARRSLQGQMRVDFAAPELPFNWQLVFEAFDVRQLFARAATEGNYARLSGRWNMQGKLLRWFESSGELVLDALQVRHRPEVTRERAFLLQLQEAQRILFTRGKLEVVGDRRIAFHSGEDGVGSVAAS